MGTRFLALGLTLLLPALAACGSGTGGETTAAAPTTTRPTPVSPEPMAITVFRLDGGVLRPRVMHVPRTQAVANAALGALGVGGTVSIAGGTATVDLAKLPDARQAEVVYTLTQFPTVKDVDIAGRSGLTRDDFAAYVPVISVETPAAGATVPATFHVSGTASVFEATLVVQAVRGGTVLEKQTATASEGAPGRGTFAATLHATAGPATIQVFSPSAADGSPQHEVDVAVTVAP